LQPIFTGPLQLVNKSSNGLKFIAQLPDSSPPTTVLHVYGTQYGGMARVNPSVSEITHCTSSSAEMGFAYGQLMSKEMATLIPMVMVYLENQFNSSIPPWVPEPIRQAIEVSGL
jgi:hypothetical protein